MSYSKEQIQALFTKFDKNGDGFISREELAECLKEANIKHTPEMLNRFFEAADTNKDGKISLVEFTLFANFLDSKVKDLHDLVDLMFGSLNAVKKLNEVNFTNLKDHQAHKFRIHDVTIKDLAQLNSCLQFFFSAGVENTNERMKKSLGAKLDEKHFLALKFEVKEKAAVIGKLPKVWADAKAFLKELGPEAGEFLENVEVDFLDASEGVIAAFRAKPDSLISHYLDSLENSAKTAPFFSSAASVTIGSDLDLSKLENLTYEELLHHKFFFDYESDFLNLSNVLCLPEVQSYLTTVDLSKDHAFISFVFTLLAVKSATIDVQIDDELKKKLVLATENAHLKDTPWKKVFADLLKLWGESPVKEMVESMEFLKEGINLLHDTKLESVGIFLQIKNYTGGVNIKASLYEILHKFFPLK